jgi:hypothetical protein
METHITGGWRADPFVGGGENSLYRKSTTPTDPFSSECDVVDDASAVADVVVVVVDPSRPLSKYIIVDEG